MDNKRTIDSILLGMKEWVEDKQQVSPQQWVTAAEYLNVLIGDEHNKLYHNQQSVSRMKLALLPTCKSVAEVKLRIEATDEYRDMKLQEAKIGQINEFIRIAKLQARLKSEEIKNY